MSSQRLFSFFIIFIIGLGMLVQPRAVQADENDPLPSNQTSAYEMIIAMNTLRVAYGLPALIEDPIVNAVAQSTAQIMAANSMSWHIGDVRGRIASAGYGSGATVWATENFAVSSGGMGIDQIMAAWADPDHMRPAVTPAYCHVGAGVATVNGKTYYILQAAYVSGQECGSYSSSDGGTSQPGSGVVSVPQIIIPVKIATPDADGRTYHIVQAGQSFWSIAITYQITIQDIETWNNTSRNIPLQSGQRLFIPNKNTEGYSTPTPVGMVALQGPDADGRIIHEVQPYQALITIADAYKVTVDRILALNGLQESWPLQVGQKLMISPGNITPSPTLSSIQRLTPDTDGRYYHTVQSGETLSWIASLYDVPLADLMNWNGLNNNSIIRTEQKLLLLVTLPVTPTVTSAPTTITPSPFPTSTLSSPTENVIEVNEDLPDDESNSSLFFVILILVLLLGGVFWWRFSRINNH